MFGLAVENVGDINQDGYPGEWKLTKIRMYVTFLLMPDLEHLFQNCKLHKEYELSRYCNLLLTDIAVGAPYDGSGKVYIYHGSKNGINTKPAQVTK